MSTLKKNLKEATDLRCCNLCHEETECTCVRTGFRIIKQRSTICVCACLHVYEHVEGQNSSSSPLCR